MKLRLLIAGLAFAAVLPAMAAAETAAPRLQEVDARSYIETVARDTGKTFIVDSDVEGVINAYVADGLTPEQQFELFEATLSANGYVAKPSVGGAYRIRPVGPAVQVTAL